MPDLVIGLKSLRVINKSGIIVQFRPLDRTQISYRMITR